MRRIFVDPSQIESQQVQLSDESFHHAVSVLRMKSGEEFGVMCGDGYLYQCRLEKIEKKSASAQIVERIKLPELPKPEVHLAISLPRLNTFEWILEKSVELGVKSIQPLTSEFSFIKRPAELSENKIERLQKILRGATEQSQRGDLMELKPLIPLADWLKGHQSAGGAPCLFAYEGAETMAQAGKAAKTLKGALTEIKAQNPQAIWALSGSEGGFSMKEVQLLQSFNHFPVSMGHQILRAETACLALVSVIKYEFDHMGDANGPTG
ncbi:MAG: RsmE family RNA methyltransferase [Bdellovibrionota bacterium]